MFRVQYSGNFWSLSRLARFETFKKEKESMIKFTAEEPETIAHAVRNEREGYLSDWDSGDDDARERAAACDGVMNRMGESA